MMLGQTIGRYPIVGKLGERGMGTVWKAIDRTLGRPVARPSRSAASPGNRCDVLEAIEVER